MRCVGTGGAIWYFCRMKAASLFAGLGGFDLAMDRLGLRSSLLAEIDPAARRVLAAQFPGVRQEGDARAVDLRGFDLVTAGFPCQGLSPAAATREHEGLMDERSRSNVVWDVLERVRAAKVPLVLLENSSALTTARYASDMAALLQRLLEYGYDARVYVLNAGCYGTPMRRLRAFVLARLSPGRWPSVDAGVSWSCDAPTIGLSGQQGGAVWCAQPSPTLKAAMYTIAVTPDDVRSLTPDAVEVLMGLTPGWTTAAGSNAQRYERLGNAVSVDAAEAALRILLTGEAPTAITPRVAYPLDRTVRARGGTSGSMVRRIRRSLESDRGNHNRIELGYALPVYVRRMREDSASVTREQWEALAWLEQKGVVPASPKPWPRSAVVEMAQPGLLPSATVPALPSKTPPRQLELFG